MQVIKASGRKEKFRPNKIYQSLKRAGASNQIAKKVSNEIKENAYNNIPTEKILNLALQELKNYPNACAKYNLKHSIMQLGPAGYPFEKYFAAILEAHGFKVEVGKIVKGKYINHEIDVSAVKDKRYLVEAKFHNHQGIHTGAKTALYIYARFLDLKKHYDQPWIVTNTRISPDVIKYSRGVNMKVTAWSYPHKENLQQLIESKQLYPITILRSVKGKTKDRLSHVRIVIAKDLLKLNHSQIKHKTGLSDKIINNMLNEVKQICEFED
jgi:hypothetical protein